MPEYDENPPADSQLNLKLDTLIAMLQNIITLLGYSETNKELKIDLEALLQELKNARGNGMSANQKSGAIAKAESLLARILG